MGQLCGKRRRSAIVEDRDPEAASEDPNTDQVGDTPQEPSKASETCEPEDTNAPIPICDLPANTLNNTDAHLDISTTAAPRRIRLLDCQALAERGTLRILEFREFPTVPYSAISYPWRGVAVDSSSAEHTFSVKGAEDADPVSIDVLQKACAASLARGNLYLWLDRLCIVQTSREDKNWQIKNMYGVYKMCNLCIVVPGGVQRLLRLDEETPWIHRSWTLQEVLAPPEVVVLFDWKLGSGKCMSGGTAMSVEETTRDEAAIAPLPLILQACTVGTLSFSPAAPDQSTKQTFMVEASVFSARPAAHAYNDIPFWRPQRKLFAPNVAALSAALDPVLTADPDVRAHTVWQSALMRTSSRPVDMVFSIMGVFGVALDPAAFAKDDRRGATIALARAILAAGGSASWLGVGCRVGPERSLSTFPTFPQTTVAGAALVRTRRGVQEVSELVDPVYPVAEALVPLPKGHMDESGYFTFSAKAVKLQPSTEHETGEGALDGTHWVFEEGETCASEDAADSTRSFAAVLGWFNQYHPGMTPADDTDNIWLILLVEHDRGKFHVQSFFKLHRKNKSRVLGWEEREFSVGGSGKEAEGEQEETAEASHRLAAQTYSEREPPWPRVPGSRPVVTAMDKAIRKARWAVPQRSLERHVQERS